jgi:single-strand DNA-binding protein
MSFPSANKVLVIGKVSAPPQVRSSQNGKDIMTFRVRTTRKWSDNEYTTTHRVVVFGNMVDQIRNLGEGSLVGVDGRIENRKYESNGEDKWITEIVANDVQVFSEDQGQSDDQGDQIPF